MDQQRVEEIVREIMRRGEYNPGDVDNGRGHGNGYRHRQDSNDRDDRNDRSLRYSMRDIPTYDVKGDTMPHTHLIEFEDFLVNTGSEINELPQFDEPQPADIAHYQGVIKDVVSKFKASLKGKPRLWSGRSKGRNQSSRERRKNSGTRYGSGLYCEHCKMTNHDITHCFKLQKTLKKKGIEWSEMNKKVKDDQELYQKFMKFLEIESTN